MNKIGLCSDRDCIPVEDCLENNYSGLLKNGSDLEKGSSNGSNKD